MKMGKKKISKKLSPCPFCGSGTFFDTYDIITFSEYMMAKEIRVGVLAICANKECGASLFGSSKKDVMKKWNTRVLLASQHRGGAK